MTKEKIIEKVDKKLLTFKLDRLMRAKTGEERYMIKKEIFCYIDNLFSFQKQEIVEEIEKVLPKEEEFEEDESKYPDARWQRENYGKKKYDQAIKQVKHNISTFTQTIKTLNKKLNK